MVPCCETYRGAHKSLARATSQFILFDGENISFDASRVIQGGARNVIPFYRPIKIVTS